MFCVVMCNLNRLQTISSFTFAINSLFSISHSTFNAWQASKRVPAILTFTKPIMSAQVKQCLRPSTSEAALPGLSGIQHSRAGGHINSIWCLNDLPHHRYFCVVILEGCIGMTLNKFVRKISRDGLKIPSV